MPSSPRIEGPRSRAPALLILVALCWLTPRCAAAVDATSLLPMLQEQRRDAEERERQQRLRRLRAPSAINVPDDSTERPPASTPCWPITGIRLAGNTLMAPETLNRALEPLLQPCMDETRINAVLKAITRSYLDQGYLAARPYLASAPEAGASLDIVIVEGFVESVEFEDPQLPLSLSRAFPDLLGSPLRLAALEQGLNQMNRLQSFDLSADLEPGELPGGTRVLIRSQRTPTSRWRLGAGINNGGDRATGRVRTLLSVSIDSPLEHNDFLHLSRIRSLPGRSSGSEAYGIQYNTPYGPWSFSLRLNRIESRTDDSGGAANSQSDFYSLGLSRELWHNASATLNADLTLNYKRLDSRFSGQWLRLRLQSPTLTTLDASLNLTWRDQALWSATLGYSRGLGWFGSDTAAAHPNAPQPLFHRYQASLWQLRQGADPGFRWRWESALNLQYSPVPLAAVEQMAISGDSAVRGFRQATVSGASGIVWRNSLSLPLAHPLPERLEIRPSLGLDVGWSRYDHGRPSQRLVGAQAGLQVSHPWARLTLGYHRALSATDTRRRDLEPGYWLAELHLPF